MNIADELKQAMSEFMKGNVAQLRWAKVKSIDWQDKTLEADGMSDGLPYYDVQLGAGGMWIRPAVGSMVLLGILEGQEAAAILLASEKIEMIEVDATIGIVMNGGENGGMVLSDKLTERLNVLESEINELKNGLAGWIPVAQDGGAALKTAISGWTGKQLEMTVKEKLENKKVKQ